MKYMNLEPGDDISDYNDFCRTLYDVMEDEDVKAALEDQRG
jgi:hypothetical protein